jgi:hypothetical protein
VRSDNAASILDGFIDPMNVNAKRFDFRAAHLGRSLVHGTDLNAINASSDHHVDDRRL